MPWSKPFSINMKHKAYLRTSIKRKRFKLWFNAKIGWYPLPKRVSLRLPQIGALCSVPIRQSNNCWQVHSLQHWFSSSIYPGFLSIYWTTTGGAVVRRLVDSGDFRNWLLLFGSERYWAAISTSFHVIMAFICLQLKSLVTFCDPSRAGNPWGIILSPIEVSTSWRHIPMWGEGLVIHMDNLKKTRGAAMETIGAPSWR